DQWSNSETGRTVGRIGATGWNQPEPAHLAAGPSAARRCAAQPSALHPRLDLVQRTRPPGRPAGREPNSGLVVGFSGLIRSMFSFGGGLQSAAMAKKPAFRFVQPSVELTGIEPVTS